MPKIYHVNWFRVNQYGISLWTGYGENIRVVDWIIRRLNNECGIGKVCVTRLIDGLWCCYMKSGKYLLTHEH